MQQVRHDKSSKVMRAELRVWDKTVSCLCWCEHSGLEAPPGWVAPQTAVSLQKHTQHLQMLRHMMQNSQQTSTWIQSVSCLVLCASWNALQECRRACITLTGHNDIDMNLLFATDVLPECGIGK